MNVLKGTSYCSKVLIICREGAVLVEGLGLLSFGSCGEDCGTYREAFKRTDLEVFNWNSESPKFPLLGMTSDETHVSSLLKSRYNDSLQSSI